MTAAGRAAHIREVRGKLVGAKLPDSDAWGAVSPYCLIKGIRGNGHFVHIHTTRRCPRTTEPNWNEEFAFDVPDSWGALGLVGLKFFIFSAGNEPENEMGNESFIGGTNADLYDAVSGVLSEQILSVSERKNKVKGTRRKNATLKVQFRVIRDMKKERIPGDMMSSEAGFTVPPGFFRPILALSGQVVRCKHLYEDGFKAMGDARCVVRVVMLNGVQEIFRTNYTKCKQEVNWHETFDIVFEVAENGRLEPMLLLFDVFSGDNGHLGSAMFPLENVPEGGTKRYEVFLHGGSQMLEQRLTEEGDPMSFASPACAGSRVSMVEKKGRNRLASLFESFRNNFRRVEHEDHACLVFEVNVIREDLPLAFHRFVEQPMHISEDYDLEKLLNFPDWQIGVFDMPSRLLKAKAVVDEGKDPAPATMLAEEKVVFVCGEVTGACVLPNTDIVGKSDPYCIIEGDCANRDPIFIHRTRVIQDNLCPLWKETFFFRVPEDFKLDKIKFSVYDDNSSTEGIEALSYGADDFLGCAYVPLSAVPPFDGLVEEIPLGQKARGRQKLSPSEATFCRNPAVSVRVFAQKRLAPVYFLSGHREKWVPQKRHAASRFRLGHEVFQDWSQMELQKERSHVTAAKVLDLRAADKLMPKKNVKRKKWIETPDLLHWGALAEDGRGRVPVRRGFGGDDEDDEGADEKTGKSQQRWPHDQQMSDDEERTFTKDDEGLYDLSDLRRSGAPPKHSTSPKLPTLYTRFGTEFARRQYERSRSEGALLRFRTTT